MNVTLHPPADSPLKPSAASGPGDLRQAGPGWLLTVSGPADGAYAPAIGLAVMRGASVRRRA